MLFIRFFSRFFFLFLELYHWSLFGMNNAWHVVFDMNEVRIFRLLLIKNWSILQQLNYQVIVFFPLMMMLWRLVSTSPTTKRFCVLFFVWNFVLIIVMIMKFNWFFFPMENVPIQSTYHQKLILQPTVFSGNTNTHLVLNASLKFCLNLKFTQPNFFLSKTHYWFTTTNFDLISWSSFTKVLIAVLLKCYQLKWFWTTHIILQKKKKKNVHSLKIP